MAFDFSQGAPAKTGGFDFSSGTTIDAGKTAPAASEAGSVTPESMLQKHLWGPLSDVIQKRTSNVESAVDRYAAGKQGLAETAVQTGAQAIGGVTDIAAKAVGATGKQYLKGVLGPAYAPVAGAAKHGLMDLMGLRPVKQATEAVSAAAAAHPRAAADIGAAVDIASALPLDFAAEGAAKAASGTMKAAGEITAEASAAAQAARVAKADEEATKLAGAIAQGSTEDAARAREALSRVDTKGAKTYQDLSGRLDEKLTALRKAQDAEFEANKAAQHLDLEYFDKKYPNGTVDNPVKNALGDLETYYSAARRPADASRIQAIVQKADKEGLSVKEVNDLAREYGSTFSARSFSARTGEPLTSLKAETAEGTRKALKTVSRDLMPTEAAKELDKQMSDLINTKDLIDGTVEKVNALGQKVKNIHPIRKVGRAIGEVAATGADILTLGIPKTLLKRAISPVFKVGETTMNAVELEKALSGNLKKLDRLLQMTDPQLKKVAEGSTLGAKIKDLFTTKP